MIPGTVEVTVDRRLLPGQTPEDVEPILRSSSARRRLRARDDRALGRHTLAARHAALGRDRAGFEATEPGAKLAPPLLRRLHRLALAARGVRHRRLRLLPDERDGSGARGAADPLGRRAHARRRPRARRRLPPRRRPLAGLADARAALAGGRVRADRGVPARARLLRARRRGARGGPLSRLRPLGAAAPDGDPRRRSRARCRSRPCPFGTCPRDSPSDGSGSAPGSGPGRDADTPPPSRRCARRSGAATSTRSTSSST